MLMELAKEEVVMILGIKNDLRSLQEKIEIITDVLSDAERRRIEDKAVNGWLSKLKDVMYDADDIIDLCKIKSQQLLGGDEWPSASSSASSVRQRRFSCLFSCYTSITSIQFNHTIAQKIKVLNNRLEEIQKNKLMLSLERSNTRSNMVVTKVNIYQTSPSPPLHFVGRGHKEAVNKLVNSLVTLEGDRAQVFAIVGLGGIGKTTIAQQIYNHQKLEANFQIKLWVCVSQDYSETELLKQIIRSVMGDQDINAQTKAELVPKLMSAISGKKFFLVMDDVWRADVWENLLKAPLNCGSSGSRILITTRNKEVAKDVQAAVTHYVDKLSIDDGWLLLSNSVFESGVDDDDDELKNLSGIGKQIVEKCGGLPLAIKTICGVLKRKDRTMGEWEKVYRSHLWLLEGDIPEEVRGALYLSYEDLPSHLKQCFLYCSLWPEDFEFYANNLALFWIAEGFVTTQGGLHLEDVAETYYFELISRSFLLPNPLNISGRISKMHDLIRSLGLFLAKDESCCAEATDTLSNIHQKEYRLNANPSSKIRRLGINYKVESSGVLTVLENPLCLRTLIHMDHQSINSEILFQRFRNLRVLDLTATRIDVIPDSIKNLQHLRYLSFYKTTIKELPESIRCLSNLQTLHLTGCDSLHTLPKGITRLCNLRHIGLSPISHVPKGIGKLGKLTVLLGFVVGDGDDEESRQFQRGCNLDELVSLTQLRALRISKLERVVAGGIRPLEDKLYLKDLALFCTPVVSGQTLNSTRIEQTFEELSPSQSIQHLDIGWFYGLKFPKWLDMLPNLVNLELSNCILCPQLPPLGQLPQLKTLFIEGASSVVTIGLEFLGYRASTAFPNLEFLSFDKMENLEEWTCDGDHQEEEEAEGSGRRTNSIRLLPHLNKLQIMDCPKLRALPRGLQNVTSLKLLLIIGGESLREIENLPSLEDLTLYRCTNLNRISNLPALGHLDIKFFAMLKSMENLNALQYLTLWDLSTTDSLPECLSQLICTHPHLEVYHR